VSFSNYKVTFFHGSFLVQMVVNHHLKVRILGWWAIRGSYYRAQGTATRRCPIQPTIKGPATKKDAGYNVGVFLVAPCALRGTNPGLIFYRRSYFSLSGKVCQYIEAPWPNKSVEQTRRTFASFKFQRWAIVQWLRVVFPCPPLCSR